MTARNKTRWPSQRERRAVDIGPVELMNLAEWQFRNRTVVLRNLRAEYRDFCTRLLARIEKD